MIIVDGCFSSTFLCVIEKIKKKNILYVKKLQTKMLLIIQQYFKSISMSIKWRPLNTIAIDRYVELFGALLFGYIVFFIELTCAYLVYRMIVSIEL